MWWLIIFLVLVAVIIGAILEKKSNEKRKNQRSESMFLSLLRIENFNYSKKIDGFGGYYIFAIDEANEKIALVTQWKKQVVNFTDIIGVEIIEDGSTISKKSTTRTIGGAIVGGVLAGGAGAIIGGLSGSSTHKNKVSSVTVKILLRNLDNPSLVVNCFDSSQMTSEGKPIETTGKMESHIYQTGRKNADDIKDLVSIIIDRVDKKGTSSKSNEKNTKNDNSIDDKKLMILNELKEEGEGGEDEFIDTGEIDPMFIEAATLIVQTQMGSTSLIQRKMKLGYNRAGRVMDQLEEFGIVGPSMGSTAREVKVKTNEELMLFFQRMGLF